MLARDFMVAIHRRAQTGFIREAILYIAVLAGVVAVLTVSPKRAAWAVLEGVADATDHPPIPCESYLSAPQQSVTAEPAQRIGEDIRLFTATSSLSRLCS